MKFSTTCDNLKEGVSGIWIDLDEKSTVAVYADKVQGIVFGYYHDRNKIKFGCNLAISFKFDGTVSLQYADEENAVVKELDKEKLLKAVKSIYELISTMK